MEEIITANDIIENARLSSNATYEMAVLDRLALTAQNMVLNLLDRTYNDLITEYGEIPPDIKTACIMLATHLYENRTPTTGVHLSDVPYTIDCILKPYLRY